MSPQQALLNPLAGFHQVPDDLLLIEIQLFLNHDFRQVLVRFYDVLDPEYLLQGDPQVLQLGLVVEVSQVDAVRSMDGWGDLLRCVLAG